MEDESATAAELEERISDLFEDADGDGNGKLSIGVEFKKFINKIDVSLGLHLTESQIRALISSADSDDDGSISLDEFRPIATKIIQEQALHKQEDAIDSAKIFLVHGMNRAELENEMGRIFKQADIDKTGQLSSRQFRDALKITGLAISKSEANMMLAEADADGNNFISYEEFVPKAFDILAKLVADRLMARYQNEEQTRLFLFELFSTKDEAASGTLPLDDVKELLTEADLGFSVAQIDEILAKFPVEAGICNYKQGIQSCAKYIIKLLNDSCDGAEQGPQGDSFAELTSGDRLAKIVSRREFEGKLAEASGDSGDVETMSFGDFKSVVVAAMPIVPLADIESALSSVDASKPVVWKDVAGDVYDRIVNTAKL